MVQCLRPRHNKQYGFARLISLELLKAGASRVQNRLPTMHGRLPEMTSLSPRTSPPCDAFPEHRCYEPIVGTLVSWTSARQAKRWGYPRDAFVP